MLAGGQSHTSEPRTQQHRQLLPTLLALLHHGAELGNRTVHAVVVTDDDATKRLRALSQALEESFEALLRAALVDLNGGERLLLCEDLAHGGEARVLEAATTRVELFEPLPLALEHTLRDHCRALGAEAAVGHVEAL